MDCQSKLVMLASEIYLDNQTFHLQELILWREKKRALENPSKKSGLCCNSRSQEKMEGLGQWPAQQDWTRLGRPHNLMSKRVTVESIKGIIIHCTVTKWVSQDTTKANQGMSLGWERGTEAGWGGNQNLDPTWRKVGSAQRAQYRLLPAPESWGGLSRTSSPYH